MKRSITLAISLILLAAFTSCSTLVRNAVNNSTAFSNKLTINSIPKTFDEFQTLYEQMATTPEGCVALELMAMEMYRTNKSAGIKALKLVNTDTNYNMMTSRLPEIFREGDSYARPYLVASYFAGASPENGYNPNKPYEVRVQRHPTQRSQYSQLMQGTTYPYQVYCYGADTPWRPITMIKYDGDTYYKVHDCAGITSQCKQIGRNQTFHGLD